MVEFCRRLRCFLLILILGGSLWACAPPAALGGAPVPNRTPAYPSATPSHPAPRLPLTPPASPPDLIITLTPARSPTWTLVPSLTPTPVRVHQGPGMVEVPILLYHHIAADTSGNPYYVAPAQFEAQMAWLWERGYQTISVAQLVDALEQGADLPVCPIILTFDDGNADVYTQAFPIMQRWGYTGTLYLVVKYLDQPGFLRSEQVQALLAAGWDVGSHSFSHPNLAELDGERLRREIDGSREELMRRFNSVVDSFAYPYGVFSRRALRWVARAGYRAAMGVGPFTRHRLEQRFYLARRPVEARHSLDDFARFLPWQDCQSPPQR